MALIAFYVVAIIILILHFTGWLAKNNIEWIVLVLAAATFPAVYLLYATSQAALHSGTPASLFHPLLDFGPLLTTRSQPASPLEPP